MVDVCNGCVVVIYWVVFIWDIGRIYEFGMVEYICYNFFKNVNEIVSFNNYIYLLLISLG